MDLKNLHTFIQTAELGSFTRAGEKLGYSQPTVSFQIKQLEKELGVPLFERIGHTVSLTDAGHDAMEYAQQICRLSEEMTMGEEGRRHVGGLVRLAVADSLCSPLVAEGFSALRRRYPELCLQVDTGGTDKLFRLLDHNEADIVCTLDRPICSAPYIVAHEERVGVHFVAAAEHPLARKGKMELSELLQQPFLLTEKGMSYRRILDESLAERGMEIRPVLEMGSAHLLASLVEQGAGLSFLPDYVTQEAVKRGRLVRLSVQGVEVSLRKQVLHHRGKWLSRSMQAVLEHLSTMRLMEPDGSDIGLA